MNLTKSKKGITSKVVTMKLAEYSQGVSFKCYNCHQNRFSYSMELSARELLPVVKKSLVELSVISGIDYKVFVRVSKDGLWRSI